MLSYSILISVISLFAFFFYCSGHHRDLHVLTHSFPTRRSSDRRPWRGCRTPARSRCGCCRSGGSCSRCCRLGVAVHRVADPQHAAAVAPDRSEEHTSELQSLMRTSYAVFCLKKKIKAPMVNTHASNAMSNKQTRCRQQYE